MNPDPQKATEITPGVTLFTRDGSRIGNAIVVEETEAPEAAREYLKKTNQKFWLLETDFGNNVRFNDNEIHEAFELGYVSSYAEWTADRRELQYPQEIREPGPLPEHHRQWFEQLKLAASRGDLALMSCIEVSTGKNVSVICLIGQEEGTGEPEVLFTPIGHLCTEDNPFEAYGPPSGGTVSEDQEVLN